MGKRRDERDIERIISWCSYRLKSFGGKNLELIIEPNYGMSKADWSWFRDKVLKPIGFLHTGMGQRDWFLALKEKPKQEG